MPPDIVLFGIQMPTLLPIFVVVLVLQILVNRILSTLGVYGFVWHPGLFRIAIFVCLFALPCILIYS